MTRSKRTSATGRWLFLLSALPVLLLTGDRARAAEPEADGGGEVMALTLDAAFVDAVPGHSSVRPSGTGWVKINGETVTNKRITIYLWKGKPKRRAAISGRADGEGKWKWKQRTKSQGYAPFDIERNDVIHVICTNGDRVDRCYKIEEVRTDEEGFAVYFRGRQVPCG